MALIEKAIYPRINKEIVKSELMKHYTPFNEEVRFAYAYFIGRFIVRYIVYNC